jgi:hypothetical protein
VINYTFWPIKTKPFDRRNTDLNGVPQKDLTGMEKGRLTVIGPSAEILSAWVVQCQCGLFGHRRRKALNNALNTDDSCIKCKDAKWNI